MNTLHMHLQQGAAVERKGGGGALTRLGSQGRMHVVRLPAAFHWLGEFARQCSNIRAPGADDADMP